MIRAIFFDFYTVWTPDKFSYYLAQAQLNGPEVYKKVYDTIERYYQGDADINYVADVLRYTLGHPDITANVFRLNEASISPAIIDLMRNLHGHFLKVGILGNMGHQEYDLLKHFSESNQLFETIASPLALGIKTPLLNREVFVKALNGIGEPPDSTLIVSGNPYYLAFAANLGINVLQFEGLKEFQESLNQLLANN